jgi:hypothetical protein
MKKLLSIVAVAGMTAIVACGPSAAEVAKKHADDSTHLADSVAKVNAKAKMVQDSLAAIEAKKADDAKKAAEEAAKAAHEDSVAKKLIKPAKEEKGGKKK